MKYLVLLLRAQSWAIGETIESAASAARGEGGNKRGEKRIVFRFDPEQTPKVFIDRWGSLCYEGAPPEEIP